MRKIDYDGRVIDYLYDHLGRQTQENWMSGETVLSSTTFSYDLAGQLLSASDPSATYSYLYNNDGLATTITAAYAGLTPNIELDQGYDTNGYLTDVYAYLGGTADFRDGAKGSEVVNQVRNRLPTPLPVPGISYGTSAQRSEVLVG